ncbi:Protein of unknown function [Amycolatopsis marina]|uniref:DUF3618 domain-containing protein n=1 Tax=Amycolatopsis marina TaxID=490629 RepID=A0A1I1CMV5_9PSEU|nr:DUF3618 domain-containing protein [Amycolatopsis marina]SFB64001.1 Protein of unknown function [Amycolatopsis marina]
MSEKSTAQFPHNAEQARANRDLTRQELGETVEQLSHKADVPARARERAERGAEQVRDRVPQPVAARAQQAAAVVRQYPLPVAGAAVGLSLLAVKGARRKRH